MRCNIHQSVMIITSCRVCKKIDSLCINCQITLSVYLSNDLIVLTYFVRLIWQY